MKMAAATGDIATVIKLMTSTSALKPTDFIKKTVGSILFMYYMYVDKMHVRPVDMDDWVDGLLYLDAKNYILERTLQEQRDKRGNHK